MTSLFVLSAEDLHEFVGRISWQRSQLGISDVLRDNLLRKTGLPGKEALSDVQAASVEAIGVRLARFDRGLVAIGWLADQVAKAFDGLEGQLSDAIEALLTELPQPRTRPFEDRRFTAVRSPPPGDPLYALGGNTDIDDPVLVSLPLYEATFGQLLEMIARESADLAKIDLAAKYWTAAHELLRENLQWLREQNEPIRTAIKGGTARTLRAQTSNWAGAVDALAKGIEVNALIMDAVATKIGQASAGMAAIYKKRRSPLWEMTEAIAEAAAAMLDSVSQLPEAAIEVVEAIRDEAARREALDVMVPLNETLAGAARGIYASHTEGQSSWWWQAPQGDPTLDLDNLPP